VVVRPAIDVECPECSSAGRVGLAVEAAMVRTGPLRTFRDEDGRVHVHDEDPVEVRYECARGHVFSREDTMPCPACGWRFHEEEGE
jgi:hypothetical protein